MGLHMPPTLLKISQPATKFQVIESAGSRIQHVEQVGRTFLKSIKVSSLVELFIRVQTVERRTCGSFIYHKIDIGR